MASLHLMTSILWLLIGLGSRFIGGRKKHRIKKKAHRKVYRDLANTTTLQPLNEEPPIMFWRLQKVGSSSLVGLFVSYAFRYNLLLRHPSGNLCTKLESCLPMHHLHTMGRERYLHHVRSEFKRHFPSKRGIKLFDAIDAHPYHISASHQLCALSPRIIRNNLACTFFNSFSNALYNSTKEIFLLRDPLSRAVSVYYFWGELYKMSNFSKQLDKEELMQMEEAIEIQDLIDAKLATKEKKNKLQIGTISNSTVQGRFTYHGNEFTAPPLEIAQDYARHFPYHIGMPGRKTIPMILVYSTVYRSFVLFQCISEKLSKCSH